MDIHHFLTEDHERLDALLMRATLDPKRVDLAPYEEFRKGILKHIGMEEMILLPAAKRLAGKAVASAERARLDHGAITALLVPTPTPAILSALRAILEKHNILEEAEGGLYAQCEAALGAELPAVLDQIKHARDIPPAAHADGEHVMSVVRRALQAAGYADLLK